MHAQMGLMLSFIIDVQLQFQTRVLRMKAEKTDDAASSYEFSIVSVCFQPLCTLTSWHEEESFNSLIIAAAPDGGELLYHSPWSPAPIRSNPFQSVVGQLLGRIPKSRVWHHFPSFSRSLCSSWFVPELHWTRHGKLSNISIKVS